MIKVNVKKPMIKIAVPEDPKFWGAVGIQVARKVRERTESGLDVDRKRFKPYSREYREYRKEKGRSSKVNLTFTGRMLGAVASGVRATKRGAKIIMSGRQGAKAWGNTRRGRDWFGLDTKTKKQTLESVIKWMTRKNKLKR